MTRRTKANDLATIASLMDHHLRTQNEKLITNNNKLLKTLNRQHKKLQENEESIEELTDTINDMNASWQNIADRLHEAHYQNEWLEYENNQLKQKIKTMEQQLLDKSETESEDFMCDYYTVDNIEL